MPESEESITSLVDTIVTPLLENPEQLEIDTTVREDGSLLIEIHVADDDAGKVIGRQGRIIKAIRTLARAAGSRNSIMVDVELVD